MVAKARSERTSVWIKICVLLLVADSAGIAYVAFRISQPTMEDSIREEALAAAAEGEVKVELWAVSVAETVHHRLTGTYTKYLDSLEVTPAEGVVVEVLEADEDHWTARGTHLDTGISCIADDTTPVLGDEYRAYCERDGD